MHADKTRVFSTAYFPPIQYFAYMVNSGKIIIETNDNYIKQSYRNRCMVLTPNGIQTLSVPVERGSFHKVALKDLKIDYSKPWQRNHIRALKTAYNSSAFYEFMKYEVEECIKHKHTFLLDLNMSIIQMLNNLLDLELKYSLSDNFIRESPEIIDLRDSIHPKKENEEFTRLQTPYFQVFGTPENFAPDLSILDLMFNIGPESSIYLRNSV